ncbi:lipopolysaccharide assembly protein LapB [Candidatus Sororendozoicomonas aggregata]|uniref:lipopolysaccharide assembly protein LapB n=1 Tax=Candidatus Sororendozoicomonas aggregata TaxID=3073239 RepID=UPI002ED5D074
MPDLSLLVLIVVAIVIGYLLGLYSKRRAHSVEVASFNKDYFVGLNYLLNEQPEEAIDTFINALDVNSDTVDIYLALGTLFCKRGEVERSIRIHQDLLARPSLTTSQSIKVQLDLAKDYMYAGLLDRAEAILVDIIQHNHEHKGEALQQLLKIYEQEREWLKAIDIAEKLRRSSSESTYYKRLAFYYCELADHHLNENDRIMARRCLRNAMGRDRDCVRASLLLGKMDYQEGRYRDAIKSLERISRQNNAYIPLGLPLLEKCYDHLSGKGGYGGYLARCLNEKRGSTVIVAMTRLLLKEKGVQHAIDFLITQLYKHPTLKGLNMLVELEYARGGEQSSPLFLEVTKNMLALKPVYACSACGFSGKEMHWQCPGCKKWGVTMPIQGIEGE